MARKTDPTRATIKKIRADLASTLKMVGDRYDYTLKLGNARFDSSDGSFTVKLEGLRNGELNSREKDYNAVRGVYDLPPIGTELVLGGATHKITGISPRFANVFTTSNGAKYQIKTRFVANAWKSQQPKE